MGVVLLQQTLKIVWKVLGEENIVTKNEQTAKWLRAKLALINITWVRDQTEQNEKFRENSVYLSISKQIDSKWTKIFGVRVSSRNRILTGKAIFLRWNILRLAALCLSATGSYNSLDIVWIYHVVFDKRMQILSWLCLGFLPCYKRIGECLFYLKQRKHLAH